MVMMKKYLPLGILIFSLQTLAFLTSYFVTETAVNSWYQGIVKSPLSPPDWLFAPVWTTLYAMLAVALWQLWQLRAHMQARKAMLFFGVQLIANYTWSFVFFGMANFHAAFWLLVFIIFFTLRTMMTAWPVKRSVVWLLVPYLAWLGFASHLAYAVMTLNP